MDYGRPMPKLLGLGRQFGQIYLDILGIFGRFISTHFVTVSLLSMLFINQPLTLQNTKPFYIQIPNMYTWDLDLNVNLDRNLAIVCP